MRIPSRVLIRVMPSAPASSQALAMDTMSVTLGLSLMKTGLWRTTSRTAFVTEAAEAGSVPKAMPPACTFGQDTFTSMRSMSGHASARPQL